jgi:NAD(P)-dependent dehydrogenase (short-subunit alcohol dehydrogenase family)
MSFEPNASYDFSHAVVVITGAAAGIGRQVAEQFAAAGATLALLDRSASIAEVASGLGARHGGWVADVGDAESVAATASEILSRFGRADILVNNAGIGPLAPAENFPLETWDKTIAVNLRGPFLVARAFAPGMLAR